VFFCITLLSSVQSYTFAPFLCWAVVFSSFSSNPVKTIIVPMESENQDDTFGRNLAQELNRELGLWACIVSGPNPLHDHIIEEIDKLAPHFCPQCPTCKLKERISAIYTAYHAPSVPYQAFVRHDSTNTKSAFLVGTMWTTVVLAAVCVVIADFLLPLGPWRWLWALLVGGISAVGLIFFGWAFYRCFRDPITFHKARRLLESDFSDVTSRAAFVQLQMTDPARARFWRHLQEIMARYTIREVRMSDDETDELEVYYGRICTLTEAPVVDHLTAHMAVRLSAQSFNHDAADDETVRRALTKLLPQWQTYTDENMLFSAMPYPSKRDGKKGKNQTFSGDREAVV
jgi:hypothetical protein